MLMAALGFSVACCLRLQISSFGIQVLSLYAMSMSLSCRRWPIRIQAEIEPASQSKFRLSFYCTRLNRDRHHMFFQSRAVVISVSETVSLHRPILTNFQVREGGYFSSYTLEFADQTHWGLILQMVKYGP